jgi:hypothetical protein
MLTIFLLCCVVSVALCLACLLNHPGDEEIIRHLDEDRRRDALEQIMRAHDRRTR